MRIEELIIDGFKSYAVRTVITGFDPEFNSITGLNGSGKSNILDAICFVLGITNFSTVRASNMQDLIYKRGQAGVTKASVTVVFDNSDPKRGPIGFESSNRISVTRQIIIGGSSKYIVNGHKAQAQTVQNLFQSVQLNINNPNFLIMQGKITKILNMRATEILALIEEAAGTRMFEERKEKAIKTIEKKEVKVAEINDLLTTEITPKLDKLRLEKKVYLEYHQLQRDRERLTKLVSSFEYQRHAKILSNFQMEIEKLNSTKNSLELEKIELQKKLQFIEQKTAEHKNSRKQMTQEHESLKALQHDLNNINNEIARLDALVEIRESDMKDESEKLKNIVEMYEKHKSRVQLEKSRFMSSENEFNALKLQLDTANEKLHKQKELLESFSSGISAASGKVNTYQDQLQKVKKSLNLAESEKANLNLQLEDLKIAINSQEAALPQAYNKIKLLKSELDNYQKHINQLSNALESEQSMSVLSQHEKALTTQLDQISNSMKSLNIKITDITKRQNRIGFEYSDPYPGFERKSVRGLVAQLFSLREGSDDKCIALEVAAGSRLYNVVVDTDKVGTDLLQKGKLRKRVTIIPLNKIAHSKIDKWKLQKAKEIMPGKVNMALELIGYEENVANAMEYVFGNTLICFDEATAKSVTFHQDIKLRSITLKGDVYDPSGTLSGGSAPSSSGAIQAFQQLAAWNRESLELQSDHEKLSKELNEIKSKTEKARELTSKIDILKHKSSLCEEQITGCREGRLIQDYEDNLHKKTTLEKQLHDLDQNILNLTDEIRGIDADIKEFNEDKPAKLQTLEKDIAKQDRTAKEIGEKLIPAEKEFQTRKYELDFATKEQDDSNLERKECEDSISKLKEELVTLNNNITELRRNGEQIVQQINSLQEKLVQNNEECATLEKERKVILSQCSTTDISLKQCLHDLGQREEENNSVLQRVRKLLEQNPWIEDEKHLFGQENTFYDYRNQDMKHCKAMLEEANERSEKMQRTLNEKVIDMIDGIEKKERLLISMIKTIHKDRRKIEETIISLDKYKKEALEKTWKKVNNDFGEIFSELLPGNTAKLVLANPKDITLGLEVRVCLGGSWRENLTELSGGQRSLIAISLIMSLLQFKPAPMYILDEIDAALDLSHTQNIGQLIKTRFKGSQFIVVSLKEGMFLNANCIFRTRFIDGTSVVQRVK